MQPGNGVIAKKKQAKHGIHMNYSPTPYTTHVPWQVQPTDPVILPWILPGQALQPNWLHPLTQNRYMGKALGKLTPSATQMGINVGGMAQTRRYLTQ